jgi:hypothetical protein
MPFQLTQQHLLEIRDRPHILGWIAGKDKLTQLHSDWIRYCWDTFESTAFQGYRGSFKTTAMAIGCVRWMLFRPDDRIGIIRKTFTDAAEIVKMIEQIMDKPEIQELFFLAHGVFPKAVVKKYGQLRYNFKKTVTPEGNITAHGLDGSLVGHHYDRIWTDDIITLKDRISKAERERTKELIREIHTNIIDPGKPVMSTGTPWHKDDGWTVTPGEILKFPIGRCGMLSAEEIEKKKRTTTPFLYAVNYDLDITSDEGLLFQDPVYGQWVLQQSGVVGHLDAAYDGGHTCALTFMGKLPDGRKQAVGWVYPGNVKDWADEIAKKYKIYRCKLLYNETNADKGYTASLLRTKGCNVQEYPETQNKFVKISTILYEAWPTLIWAEETDDEYMNQVLDWREGQEPDDAPDSAASLLREAWQVGRDDSKALNSW